MSRSISIIFLFILTFLQILVADDCIESDYDCCASQSMQINIRHKEPKGIGYRKGYTTLEALFLPCSDLNCLYPFLDLRGHVFNDGRFAANVGIGARSICDCRIWGINAYYDYRGAKRRNYHQVSLGLESIGLRYDFYLNGYLVVGRKHSRFYDVKFDHFEGHRAILRSKIDNALSGFDGEVGYHFLKNPCWDVYLGAGPYYYKGKFTTGIFGGKARLFCKVGEYLTLEASTSYDHAFKWIGQGTIGVHIPLGKTFNMKRGLSSCCNCYDALVLYDRMTIIPNHNEIIPIKRKKKHSSAKNPLTGDPFQFIFVDNTHPFSDGSFEDPFGSLAAAAAASQPGDIIYVFKGTGTTLNMSDGIILKTNQQFLGSGTPQVLNTTLGSITISPQTEGLPIITNVNAGGNGVTLANNNTVSGFQIDQTDFNGIFGLGIGNAIITNNIITNSDVSDTSDGAGIILEGPGLFGNFIINNNVITGTTAEMHGIFFTPRGDNFCSVILDGNFIEVPKDGVEMKPFDSTRLNARIVNNTFITTTAERAFFLETRNASITSFVFFNNIFSSQGLGTGLLVQGRATSQATGSIIKNLFINNSTGNKVSPSTARFFVDVLSNVFASNTTRDFDADIEASAATGFLSLGLAGNNAPMFGYILANNNATATFIVRYFRANIGPLTTIGPIIFLNE